MQQLARMTWFWECTSSFCPCEGIGFNNRNTTICHITHSNTHKSTYTRTQWCNWTDTKLKRQTDTHTAALWVAACGLEDSEDVHFLHFLCFSSSTSTFVKSLVCLSHSWGCRTAPPVILLTHAHTISVCLSVFSPQEVHCAEQSFVKTLSSFYPALSSLHFLKPLYFWLSPLLFDAEQPNQININTHKGRGRLPILEIQYKQATIQR